MLDRYIITFPFF